MNGFAQVNAACRFAIDVKLMRFPVKLAKLSHRVKIIILRVSGVSLGKDAKGKGEKADGRHIRA